MTVADRRGVDGAVLVVAQPGLAVDRGDVVDDLDALRGALDCAASRRSPETTPSVPSEPARASSRTSATTSRPRARQSASEMTAGEAGGAGDQTRTVTRTRRTVPPLGDG